MEKLMIGVGEMLDAMTEEFIKLLSDLDHGQLNRLKSNDRDLRRMLPVGLSHREAVTMIDRLLKTS